MSFVSDLVDRSMKLLSQNSTGLLSGIGVVGTISTAILTGRASIKAVELIREEEAEREREGNLDGPMIFKEKVELTWQEFIPPVGVGSVTIFSIIMANRLASKEAAALAAMYSLSERAFTEYKDKVVEKMGENKERTIRDDVARDRIHANPVQNSQVIITGNGDVLFLDLLSGRYFESTMEKVQQAEIAINYEIVNCMSATLSDFYDKLGLPPNQMSDIMGWNINNRLEVRFSAEMSTDNRPCIAIDFTYPIYDFDKLY